MFHVVISLELKLWTFLFTFSFATILRYDSDVRHAVEDCLREGTVGQVVMHNPGTHNNIATLLDYF